MPTCSLKSMPDLQLLMLAEMCRECNSTIAEAELRIAGCFMFSLRRIWWLFWLGWRRKFLVDSTGKLKKETPVSFVG